ncbi:MAG: hypothetical protein A3H45_12535 [Ignavibacteria bacterium RIFCSPLOWO2_02_FULL_55_14]|nr:MAG: hypothetical protein A2X68_09100 [Ignavibacteria bacterium GWC2_56_12]OGU70973.1 MAG: hypothetical protein A3H45_12535 [Ignavibacteria bacterium RIFCSPLOWO2_02_FULL_55_14]
MKKVLVVSYYFPPSGGPGVQRVLKFVKYLPQFGWQPVVLTVQNGDFPARDESLLNEIPADIRVHRTKIFEPYRVYRFLTRKPPDSAVDVENIPQVEKKRSIMERFAGLVRETFFIPDARIGWFPYAVPEAMQIVRNEGIDAVYTSSPPYTTALIGLELHRRTKLPWIAGFRDPWIGFLSSPERWALPRAVDMYLEKTVYQEADLVECAWAGILEDFRRKYPEGNALKAVHLPNGFDSADYPAAAPRNNDRFTVTYTGSMYGKRNPATFLRSVEELVAEGAVDANKIRLSFVGRFGAEVKEMINRSTIRPSVERLDYVAHAESIRRLTESDLLLLIVDESKDSREIVPGKVFEYLGARKPILALTDVDGAVARLIAETSSGRAVNNQDVPSIKAAFVECYRNYLYHTSSIQPNEEEVRKYERREVTRRLAELLDYLQTRR